MHGGISRKRFCVFLAALVCLVGVCKSRADWPQQIKLTASDAAPSNYFGKAVSITADYCIIGAWGDNDKGTLSGSAYIFSRNGKNWNQSDKLTASDGAPYDNFGCSVGISGLFSIIGAEKKNAGGLTDSGQAYIFYNGTEQAKLTASDGAYNDYFGCAVAIDGNYAIAGAYNDDSKGSAYIFFYNAGSWVQQDKLMASDRIGADNFGFSVAIDGNYCVVGAPYDDCPTTDSGSAYIFERNGSTWSQETKLIPSDGADRDHFGVSVSISGDYAIAGAADDDNASGTQAGAAYIFKRDGDNWTQQAKLIASDGGGYEHFGCSVAIDGNYAVIGAYMGGESGDEGAVYIFERNETSWLQQEKLTASDAANGDQYGIAVGISGYHVLVGAHHKNLPLKNQAGSAYVYRELGSLTLQDPNGGQRLLAGATYQITWQPDAADDVLLQYSTNNGSNWTSIDTVPDTGSCQWLIPQTNSQQCLVRISDIDYPAVSDTSDAVFEIYTGTLELLTPNGGEHLISSTNYNIQWQTVDGSVADVLLEYSTNNGSNWTTIETVANTGLYQWSVPLQDSGQCLLRVSDAVHPAVKDTSDGVFTMETRTLTLQYPNGSEKLVASTTYDIEWQSQGAITEVLLEYSTNNGSDWTTIETVSNSSPYTWLVPSVDSNQCLVKITDTAYSIVNDTSDAVFSIDVRSFTLQNPNGSEELLADSLYDITWLSEGDIINVFLEYSTNNGSDWTTIETVENTGLYQWSVPNIDSNECLIRISDSNYPDINDVSDDVFSIFIRELILQSPNGGELLIVGNIYNILWQGQEIIQKVLLEYSVNNGSNWTTIETVDNTGSYEWVVPNEDSNQCLVRITDANYPDVNDLSNSVFDIYSCTLNADMDGNCLVEWYELDVLCEQWLINDVNSWFEQTELITSGGAGDDSFGISVGISGDFAIVGAYRDNDNGDEAGAVYIFEFVDVNWVQQTKLTASDGAAYDYFGGAVAIDGQYAIVGADHDDDVADRSGSAYIFHCNDVNWCQQAKLTASDPAAREYFGNSVAIDANYAIVGCWGDNSWKGSAYIFKRNGESWTEQAKITASDGQTGDSFGVSVDISGDYCIIGAYYDDETSGSGNYFGSAYIFKREDSNWIEQYKLTASDGNDYDFFGGSVSIDGDYCIVGADQDDDNGQSSGSAYIFKREDSNWIEQYKLTASDGNDYDFFGGSVSIDGDYCIVGAEQNDENGENSGSAYIFNRDASDWIEQTKLTAFDSLTDDRFGGSVAINDKYSIIGWFEDEFHDNRAGPVYIFEHFCPEADLNGDCLIDFYDFAILAEQWLQ